MKRCVTNTNRSEKLDTARKYAETASINVSYALGALSQLDPAFDRLRDDLRKIESELQSRCRELTTYASAAATIERAAS